MVIKSLIEQAFESSGQAFDRERFATAFAQHGFLAEQDRRANRCNRNVYAPASEHFRTIRSQNDYQPDGLEITFMATNRGTSVIGPEGFRAFARIRALPEVSQP